jgi:predicted TPR repeat methyltransferase
LFDQYAPKFDKTLIKDLDYCGPEVLLKAVLTTCHSLKQPAHFKRALDLGCGTGLAAREFASLADTFFGVDLSPGMIELARATALYERLDVADMVAGMREHADASINLVLAADSVVYLADLAPLLQEVMRVLASQCVVAFTVETHAGEGVILGKGLRYAHAAAYVSAAVERAGLKRQAITPVSTRTEAGDPVPGLVVTAVKT